MTKLTWFYRSGAECTSKTRDVDVEKGVATGFVKTCCGRCGGLGGSPAWVHTGYSCYACGGSGGHGMRAVKVYTRERLAKLDATKAKRDATRAEKARIAEEKRQAEATAKRDKWLETNPAFALAWASFKNDVKVSGEFLSDLANKFENKGELSEKQSMAFIEAVTRQLEAQRKDAEAEPVPSGRIEVTGEILSIKVHIDDRFYPPKKAYKMTVRDDRGFKIWGTLPSAISDASRGDRVTFTATVTPSPDDVNFGFFKRPSKAAAI